MGRDRTKKILSLNINDSICVDINVLLISNYDEIESSINKYIKNREKVVNSNIIEDNAQDKYVTEFNKRIKVKTSNDYILLMILLIVIEALTIFSFLGGNHDIITIIAIIIIPLIMLKLLPYKIYFDGDRIEYKHIIHTQNKTRTIFTKDINYTEIISKVSTFSSYDNYHRNRTSVKHYTFNIYKKDRDIVSLKLLYENMGDIKQISDIINSKVVDNQQ